jgi:deoxycytidylate deaminase
MKIVLLTNKNKKFFSLAKKLACLSEYGKFKHAAVLVRHGTILNSSPNKDKACSFGKRFRSREKGIATLHAELGAVLNMPKKCTRNADIYVVRVNSEGEYRNSKPCKMCQDAMRFCGINRVYYSIDSEGFEVMKL